MTPPAAPRTARGDRAVLFGLVAGVVGLLGFALGMLLDPRRAAASYLVAYAAALGVVLGALSLVMIANVTNATWFVVLRRITERVSDTLPVFVPLFIPLLFGLRALYPWVPPLDTVAAPLRQAVAAKRAYLNVPFFLVRAAVYLAAWCVLAELVRRASRAVDRRRGDAVHRLDGLSAGGLVVIALTGSFASFDWLMSLSPAWYSTIYGVYFWAGGFVGALALVAVLAYLAERDGSLGEAVTPEHYHAIGKLVLTFLLFWAYIGFSQLIVIWSADIPAEAAWYLPRLHGSWGALGLVLVFGHFALPFLLLLPRWTKRHPRALAPLAVWLLVMHYLDVYWLVLPEVTPGALRPHWLDLAGLLAVLGPAVAFGAWRARGTAALPLGDPALAASLRYAPTEGSV